MNKDNIYKQPINNIEDFTFDQTVSDAFDDMVDRSVPGYRTLIANIGPIASHFYSKGTNCYDLGCSHGAASLSVFNQCLDKSIQIHAIDNSAAMIDKCKVLVHQANAKDNIHMQTADICDIPIHNASVVILNLTLQFLPVDERQQLLEKIYRGMIKGGVCILTEKIILGEDQEELYQQLHTKFKAANHYSDLEISQKRKALDNVLIREPLETHQKRLNTVNFSHVSTWFQCINFISLLAIK